MHTLPEPVWRRIMQDYLRRGEAPLAPAAWERLDTAVAAALGAHRVARRFLPVHGTFGPGLQAVPAGAPARVPAGAPARAPAREEEGIELPIIHWDFMLASAAGALPDLEPATAAATTVALAEDHLIFNGHTDLDHLGLLAAPAAPAHPLADLPGAAARLAGAGRPDGAPLALALAPDLAPAVPAGAAGLCRAGVHVSPVLPPGAALLVACDPDRLDLAVAQEAVVAYQGAGRYRLFELAALRIKAPGAVCHLTV